MLDLNALPLPRLFEQLTSDGSLDRLLEAARYEDLGDAGDVSTACILGGGRADGRTVRAAGVAREPGVIAGMAAVGRVLEAFECTAAFEPLTGDGERCAAGQALWRLLGELVPILAVERTLLNLVGRLSGIATLTRRYVNEVAGTNAVVCDTRKTTPGMRAIEKYAVRCGGGTLHRLGLYDAVLLKDNHLAHLGPTELAPAVAEAARAARAGRDLRFVGVEVDTLEQLRLVLQGQTDGIDIVLLDNMSLERLREAVAIRDAIAPRVQLEASGRIVLQTVRAVAETGVDRISVGSLTHSPAWLDVSLEIS
ncbi:MAG: carboxylating nicotinate-nucleotide diphosphorylase [Planctomycetota bacterium]|jgi:nicotinate-nucleotide pyrophosphorylase (carboxylating)